MIHYEITNQFIIYFIGSLTLLVSLTMNDLIKYYFLNRQSQSSFFIYSILVIIIGTFMAAFVKVSHENYMKKIEKNQ